VPPDRLEAVTGAAQNVTTIEDRGAAVALLTKARTQSNVRSRPYRLKTSFRSYGSLPSDGSWSMEDMSPAGLIYRWAAQGPGYSGVNLYTDSTRGLLFSNQPNLVIPTRLAQVRSAIFFPGAVNPNMAVRTASGVLDGKEQTCLLLSRNLQNQVITGSRNWLEEEYCVDRATGLMTIHSVAPGLYVHYLYPSAPNFHGLFVATGFEIEQAGKIIVEAKTESIADPPDAKDPLFSNAGLTAIGAGEVMSGPTSFADMMPPTTCMRAKDPSACLATSTTQVVSLHGTLSPDGQLTDTEVLGASDPNLVQTALTRYSTWKLPGNRAQPGTTPQTHEIFVTLRVIQAGQ
jgi:hypothetical protein